MMSLGSSMGSRWKSANRPGQAMTCSIVAKVDGGYDVVCGPDRLRGYVPTESALAVGVEMLLKFIGYQNHVAVFSVLYGLEKR